METQNTKLLDEVMNKEGKGTEEIHRVTISRTAERALTSVTEQVNEKFDGGKVNRTQVANWIILKFSENICDEDIREIRVSHFDEIAVFEALLRRAKETGVVPPEIKSLLQKELGFNEMPRKLKRQGLTKNNINDVIKDDDKKA